MHDEFVPLDAFLRPAAVVAPREEDTSRPAPALAEPVEPVHAEEFDDAYRAVRCFRAALADALDVAVAALLEDIAACVVARELRLAPADVAAIVARARERFAGEEPVAIRVHPDDAAAIAEVDVAIVADPALRRGDVNVVVKAGTIDASLGARLACVLRA